MSMSIQQTMTLRQWSQFPGTAPTSQSVKVLCDMSVMPRMTRIQQEGPRHPDDSWEQNRDATLFERPVWTQGSLDHSPSEDRQHRPWWQW